MLTWAIRRATLNVLVQNMKQTAEEDPAVQGTDINAQQRILERRRCIDWISNENLKFFNAIENLSFARVYRVLYYQSNGAISVMPCLLGLWSAFGSSSVPNAEADDSAHIGLKWEILDPTSLCDSANDQFSSDVTFTDTGAKIMSFADIVDVIVAEHGGSKMGGSHEFPVENKMCRSQPGKIVSICSKFGYSIEIMACCLNDYDRSLLSIRDIWLQLAMNKKLTKAAAGKKYLSSKQQSSPSVVLAHEFSRKM